MNTCMKKARVSKLPGRTDKEKLAIVNICMKSGRCDTGTAHTTGYASLV